MIGQREKIPFVDVSIASRGVDDEIRRAIDAVIDRGDFTLGRDVTAFENEFAAYCGANFAVGVGSGTDALHLSLIACGVGPGDEVITTANTFIATAEAIVMCGARPVLVDVDERTYNMDVDLAAQAVTERTKAVVPVHLYGQVADMGAVWKIASGRNLMVIEDACQAHGARHNGRRAGSLGHAAAFSFYPSKNLGAYGDGGAIVTNDGEIAERIRLLRNHGEVKRYHHLEAGHCSRLHSLQAAILRVKLSRLDEWNAERRKSAATYDSLLGGVVGLPRAEPSCEHVYHLYVVRASRRDELRSFLSQSGIDTGVHYPVPIHLQPAFKWLGYRPGTFPIAEKLSREIVSLPMFPGLTEEDMQRVASNVAEFAEHSRWLS